MGPSWGPVIFEGDHMEKKKMDVGGDFESLVRYRKALVQEDQEVFDRLLFYAKNHASACAKSERNLFESMLLAMVLEQQKVIDALTVERGEYKPRHPVPNVTDEHHGESLLSLLDATTVKEAPPWVS